jgi:hypothetical protein
MSYGPISRTTASTPKMPSRSNAARIIRMSCVLGSTTCHTKAQIAATSDNRSAKIRTLLNMYPI